MYQSTRGIGIVWGGGGGGGGGRASATNAPPHADAIGSPTRDVSLSVTWHIYS